MNAAKDGCVYAIYFQTEQWFWSEIDSKCVIHKIKGFYIRQILTENEDWPKMNDATVKLSDVNLSMVLK